MGDGLKVSEHDPDIVYGSVETGDPYMLNADGMTRWWNSTEFTDPMPLLSYKPGKQGSQLDPSATLNPYKYFADGLESEQDVSELDTSNRGVFTPTTQPNSRLYLIQFPTDSGFPDFLFNYAVDASWEDPDPAYDPDFPLEAFGPNAQCQEAFYVTVNDEGSDAWYYDGDSGGTLVLNVEVYDWQGAANSAGVPDEIAALWIESPVLTAPIDIFPLATALAGGSTSSVFTVEITGADLSLTASGDFSLLGSIESVSPDTYEPQIPDGDLFVYPDGPLASYFMGTVTIGGDPGFEELIVTGIDPDQGYLDLSYEDVVVTGEYFQSGATVELIKNDTPGVVIAGTDVNFVDATELDCDFDFDSFADPLIVVGVYDVVVTNPDLETGQLDDGFEIVEFPCAPEEWGDDFESYTVGSLPTAGGWVNFWSGYIPGTYITDEQAYSGTQSFRQSAYTNWARYDGMPFTAETKTFVCYEARVMLTHAGRKAVMGFAWKKTPSTTGHYAIMVIGEPTYTNTYQWYHILAKINMSNHTWTVWVDGEKVKDNVACGNQEGHDSFTHFFIGITNFLSYPGIGTVYYDDTWLYWED